MRKRWSKAVLIFLDMPQRSLRISLQCCPSPKIPGFTGTNVNLQQASRGSPPECFIISQPVSITIFNPAEITNEALDLLLIVGLYTARLQLSQSFRYSMRFMAKAKQQRNAIWARINAGVWHLGDVLGQSFPHLRLKLKAPASPSDAPFRPRTRRAVGRNHTFLSETADKHTVLAVVSPACLCFSSLHVASIHLAITTGLDSPGSEGRA